MHESVSIESISIHEKRVRKWIKNAFQLLALYCDDNNATRLRELGDELSVPEWRKRVLDDDTMKRLGLIGSPRFSQVLASLGVPKDTLARFLSVAPSSVHEDQPCPSPRDDSPHESVIPCRSSRAHSFDANADPKKMIMMRTSHVETVNELWLLEQSESVHFTTCLKKELHKRDAEMIYYKQGLLFFWTVGLPMSLDGRGFEARAKLRVMFDQPYASCSRRNSEVISAKTSSVPQRAWLYIERAYGHTSRLFENAYELVEWWNSYAPARGWIPQSVIMKIPANYQHLIQPTNTTTLPPNISLYCPSAGVGHQDTLGDGNNIMITTQEREFCEVHSGDFLLLFLLSYSKTSWMPTRITLDQLLISRVKDGQVAGAESLLYWGADPNMPSNESPLVCAIVGGFSELVKLLLVNGASPHTRSLSGETPLYVAVMNHQKPVDESKFDIFLGKNEERGRVLELVLAAGALPNCRTDEGVSPLEAALVLDDLVAAHLLLSFGAEFCYCVPKEGSSISSTLLELASPNMTELLSGHISTYHESENVSDFPPSPSPSHKLTLSASTSRLATRTSSLSSSSLPSSSSSPAVASDVMTSDDEAAHKREKKVKKRGKILRKIKILFKRKNPAPMECAM